MITGNKLVNGIVDNLNELALPKMASALQAIYRSERYNLLDHISFLNEILAPEYNARMESRLNNRLSAAHLKGSPEDIALCVNSAAREYKPDGITETLRTLDFIDQGQNVCILGPSDIGKSYLSKALGILACSRFSVEYHHCEPLVESLAAMKIKAYDKYQKKIKQLTKRDLLIIDDFLATGAALAGLVNLVDQAGGTVVGAGIAIEKAFQGGGDQLRAQGLRIESLAKVASMDDEGHISFC